MKKIFLSIVSLIALLLLSIIVFLSTAGYETDKFNSLLENKIEESVKNTNLTLKKIKIKINIQELSFFVTTSNPEIFFHNNKVNLNRIDAYINFKSLLKGKPNIEKVSVLSNELDIERIKEVVKYSKPSNFKKFLLNEVKNGQLNFNLDLDLEDNQIINYEINGFVKNFSAKNKKINLKKTSFIYLIKEKSGEIDNIRGLINGFQISSGNIQFANSDSLEINGEIKSDLNLNKEKINNFIGRNNLTNFEKIKILGKLQSKFKINFDQTLKIIDYQLEADGDVQKSNIKFVEPQKYPLLENKINNIFFEKTNFKVDYYKDNNKLINISGVYKINNNSFQKFDFVNKFDSKYNKISLNADFEDEINIPFINFRTKKKVVNINSNLRIGKKNILLNKFNIKDDKNNINIKNLLIQNNKLVKFDNISVKTFFNNKLNNEFKINFNKSIKISGSKYDASNLTKLLENKNNTTFLKNISKEIFVDFKEVSTNVSEVMSNFSLIGIIEKGRFSKIVSKGEFEDGKYLDISLKIDKTSKKKILEIYSDLPKPLLSNYKFFDGLSGGKLLLLSTYDNKESNSNLTIESFKVKNAPGLVKLLSLADFGGMVDALSGEGLSFEKLEMKMSKSEQVLNLEELYAIGPSISILMEGYVESNTELISLRGTMVPAKTLNKFLSKLPVVGDILIPKEVGEGLFGISFKMKGTPGKIKTTVNPIKSLTPRFIQKALKKPK